RELLSLGQNALVIRAAFPEKDDVGVVVSQTGDVLRPLGGRVTVDQAAAAAPVRDIACVKEHAANFAAPALDGARQSAAESAERRRHDKEAPSGQIDRSLEAGERLVWIEGREQTLISL